MRPPVVCIRIQCRHIGESQRPSKIIQMLFDLALIRSIKERAVMPDPFSDKLQDCCFPNSKGKSTAKPCKAEPDCDNPLGICLPSYKSRGTAGTNVETEKPYKIETFCDNPLGICLPPYKSRESSGLNVETTKPYKIETFCDNPLGICLPPYKSHGTSGTSVETAKPYKTETIYDNPLSICVPLFKSRGSSGPNVKIAKPYKIETFCDNPLGICLPPYKSRGTSGTSVETAKQTEKICDNPLGICLPSFKSSGLSGPRVETPKTNMTDKICDNPLGICLPSYKSRGSSRPNAETAGAGTAGQFCGMCGPQSNYLPDCTSKTASGHNVGPVKSGTDGSCDIRQGYKSHGSPGPIVGTAVEEVQTWRRKCGCIRTSDKLKHIIKTFPSPPPPSPAPHLAAMGNTFDKQCCPYTGGAEKSCTQSIEKAEYYITHRKVEYGGVNNRSWQVVAELVQLVQLSVTATALALYYLIYCYMQLVYYTLRSALYFHHADGPMKITIGVVTLTSLVVGFNLMLRMERILGYIY